MADPDDMRGEKTAISRRGGFYLAGLTLFAFLLRLISWHSVFPEGKYLFFYQNDAYYHLRRAAIILKNFPFYPTLDYYLAYPQGAEAPWPPLYGYLLTAFSTLLGWLPLGEAPLKLAAGLLPVIFAALLVPVVFLLVRACLGPAPAYMAAFFTAFASLFLKSEPYYSMFGTGDQNTAEAFLAYLFFLLYVCMLMRCIHRGKSRLSDTLWPGLALASCLLLWQGSVLFAAVVTVFTLIVLLKNREIPLFHFHGLVMLWAALPVAVVRLLLDRSTEQTFFSFGFFSWFQPLFCMLCIPPVFIVYAFFSRPGLSKKPTVIPLLLFVIILLVCVAYFTGIATNLTAGLGYLFRQDPWLNKIAEFQPPLAIGPFISKPAGQPIEEWLQFFLYLCPVLLLIYLVRRAGRLDPGGLLMAILIIFFTPLAFQQTRWVMIYSVLIGASLSTLLYRILKIRLKKTALLIGTLILALFLPLLFTRAHLATILGSPLHGDLFSGLVWLRKNTPSPGDPLRPDRVPRYGVMAHWNIGHWLTQISRRPAVATPFGTQLRGGGFEDSLAFCMTSDENRAAVICEKRRVRYVLMDDFLYSLCELSDMVEPGFRHKFFTAREYQGLPYYFPDRAFYRLVYPRMYLYDASETDGGRALTRFRLIWESAHQIRRPYYPIPVNTVKIYEFIRGARLFGSAAPGSAVRIEIDLISNQARRFKYRATVLCGPSGMYRLVVPYATEAGPHRVRSKKPYAVLNCEGVNIQARISESDVRQGHDLRYDFN